MGARPSAVIVGGSVAGLAAAVTLSRAGWQTMVLERSRGKLADRGAGLGLDLGPLREVLGSDGRLPPHVLTHGREIAFAEQGTIRIVREPARSTHVSWQGVYSALRGAYTGELRAGVSVSFVGTAHGGAWLALVDGSRLQADLVVGADGYRSTVRTAVAPDDTEPAYAGYVLWRGVLERREMPEDAAERLLDGRLHLFAAPGRHLVLYGVPGAQQRELGEAAARLNWGWYDAVAPHRLAELLGQPAMNDPRNVPVGTLPTSTVSWLADRAEQLFPAPWKSAVVSAASHGRLFAAAVHEHAPTRILRDRLVLVGDAAHVASPITGAGARTALQDAVILGQALGHNGHDLGRALAAFEDKRLPVAHALVAQGMRWSADFLAESRLSQ